GIHGSRPCGQLLGRELSEAPWDLCRIQSGDSFRQAPHHHEPRPSNLRAAGITLAATEKRAQPLRSVRPLGNRPFVSLPSPPVRMRQRVECRIPEIRTPDHLSNKAAIASTQLINKIENEEFAKFKNLKRIYIFRRRT